MRSRPLLSIAILALGAAPASSQGTERLYREACANGDAIACNVFGLMREHGAGVNRDLADAATLYRRACEGGLLVGCTNLALLYDAGAGVQPDSDRATGLYRTACEGGELLGCDLLASMRQAPSDIETRQFFKSGRVTDAETGTPLSEAVIELPTVGLQVVSDRQGHFSLGRLLPGRYRVRVERFGYAPVQGEFEVPGNAEFILLLERARLEDPTALGRIEGRVAEVADQGLSDVEIGIVDQDAGGASTLSNQQGRFILRDVRPGLVELRFVRLGYAPRTARLIVQPGRTAQVAATMSPDPIELEPIEVTVRSRSLEQNGFYDRSDSPWGTHFTPQDLERIQPMYVSDLLWRVPGVTSVGGAPVSRRSRSPTLGPCALTVYLDGVRLDPSLRLVDIPPSWLDAVEVYHGIETPEQFRPNANACGAVVLWTKR